ncbi:MAG: efflux RND transporter permease subunit [Gammaproteobacteria bacterium]|nr:efflux RND transporter permease subunit [Gammaproteobacteria bacterium]
MQAENKTENQKGLIAWFAGNSVAANLLMVFILAFGIYSSFTIRKQTTPDFELNVVQVQVPYPGAAPQEVEEGVVVKVEEAIQDVDGILQINSTASEGIGVISAEVRTGESLDDVLADIKTRVDAIATFPGLAEKPIISKQEIPVHVLFVALYGDIDEFGRKAMSTEIRDELMLIQSVSEVQILGGRSYEISIEVSEDTLRAYGLTMSEISQAINNSSVDLPGGQIKSEGGDILLRTEGQVYTGREYADLVLRTFPDGTRLTIGDIANIKDGFVESEDFGRFNGEPSVMLRIMASGGQSELETADDVRAYIAEKVKTLPAGVMLETWVDRSHYLRGRLDMMVSNMLQGALLVFVVLSLFLRLKVAMWVIVGIPIAFFGTIWLMPHAPWPITINVISLFGFILVLGIVVDDAIIIAESIYTEVRARGHTLANVIRGANRVAVAATFGVLTTIAAFTPMLFVGGIAAPFFEALSVVVILALIFSLIESKLILPAHLAHAKIKPVDEKALFDPDVRVSLVRVIPRTLQRFQRRFQHGFKWLTHNAYEPLLNKALDYRGFTVSLFIAMLIITGGAMAGGVLRVVIFPDVPGDFIQVQLAMHNGTAPQVRNEAVARLERAALDLNAEYVADHPGVDDPVNHIGAFSNGDTGAVIFVEMPLDENRPLNGDDITGMWRDRVGEIAGVKDLSFSAGNNIGGGDPLSFKLTGDDLDSLEAAAKELQEHLGTYDGVFDISNSISSGGQEIRLKIRPEAEALGLTQAMLGRQVRQAFYGEEAQRIQRGKDELKVMVRYPLDERRSIADLENMRIRTPAGDEVPFDAVAEVFFGSAYSSISRQDRKRTVTVSADIDPEQVEPGEILEEIREEYIPELLAQYPGVGFSLEGASQEQINLLKNLALASLAALFLMFALIAIPLRSYSQPLIIMSVIPFGLIGAAVGHLLMDRSISMFSLFGLVALSGVVVNDSLIMVDFVNKARRRGVALREAVVHAGVSRFRAIILTSLTTAAGLMPILMEKSVQAQFVIPMAISISFGIIFATVITLFLIPTLYVMLEDFSRFRKRARNFLFGHSPLPQDSR